MAGSIEIAHERGVPPSGPTGEVWSELAERLRELTGLDGSMPGRVTVYTLTVTRWVAVVGQLFAVLFVHFSLGIEISLAALLPAIGLSAFVNLILTVRHKATTRLSERSAAALHAYDILQLCYLLAFTGGVQNPFAALLLVPIALASATLTLRSTTIVTGLALLALAALAVEPGGLPWRGAPLVLPGLYQLGMAVALVIATVLVAVFVWGIAEAARRQADALNVAQLALAREQQLSALGGQAAAAAHLLGTPLGTITIIAKELVRELPEGSPLAEDAAELLAQAQRCRELLKALGRPADDPAHERFTAAPLTSALEQIAAEHARPEVAIRVLLRPVDDTPEPSPAMTPEIRHSLANLIDNAIRFARTEVAVTVRPARTGLVVEVEDDGPGFPAEVLDWVGEPFISTRKDEGGLGLGIFIATTLLARTGAKLHFGNTARGARVAVAWPPGALGTARGS